MSERKIFAGHRLRRIRNRLGLSQAEMAGSIGISPSYLNLIERNQRPITVQVLLKLSESHDVSAAELMGEDREANAALKEIFTDPLMAAEMPGPSEIIEVAEAAPNFARAVVRLHEAYRGALERLSDLSTVMARDEGAGAKGQLPFDRVVATLEEKGPFFASLEGLAETLHEDLKPRDDIYAALRGLLLSRFGVEVRVLPVSVMPVEAGRFDRHSMRLFLSERLSLLERADLLARQVALMAGAEVIEKLMDALFLKEAEERRVGRLLLAQELALGLIAPLSRLLSAWRSEGFDIALLAHRFSLSPHDLMRRLVILSRKEDKALPPLTLLIADRAGNILERQMAAGFPFPRFGAPCPLLPLYGDGAERHLKLADGRLYRAFTILHSERRAMLAYTISDEADEKLPIAAGLTCRLCEKEACPARLHPPAAKPSALQDYVMGFSPFDLV